MRSIRLPSLFSLLLAAAVPAQGLVWGTMFDGNVDEGIHGVTRDAQGRVFVCGWTTSTDLPTTPGAYQTSQAGGVTDGFVACLDLTKSGKAQLVWGTYFGGRREDMLNDLLVDPTGRFVTVVGYTDSTESFLGVPQGARDCLVMRFDLQQTGGAQLVWSNRFGGSGDDVVSAIVANGSLLTIAGQTAGQGFPASTVAAQPTYGGGVRDAFAAQLDAATGQILRATFLGGSGDEGSWDSSFAFHNRMVRLAVDGIGDVFVAGPVSGAFLRTTTGQSSAGGIDAFVCRLNSALTVIRYATLDGGGGNDFVRGITIDRDVPWARWIAFAGGSTSPAYPATPNALQSNGAGSFDFFVTQLDVTRPDQHVRMYSTLLGGVGEDQAHGVHVDGNGGFTILGGTAKESTTWPITPGAPKSTRTALIGEIALVRLRAEKLGTKLIYSTFFGGETRAAPVASLLDGEGGVVFAGQTASPDHPTSANAYQSGLRGARGGCIAIHDLLPIGAQRFGAPGRSCLGSLWIQVDEQPRSPAPTFALTAHRAPIGATGVIAIGSPNTSGWSLPPIQILVNPLVILGPLAAGGDGFARLPLPIPSGLALNGSIAAQWVWLGTSGCGDGQLHASNAVRF